MNSNSGERRPPGPSFVNGTKSRAPGRLQAEAGSQGTCLYCTTRVLEISKREPATGNVFVNPGASQEPDSLESNVIGMKSTREKVAMTAVRRLSERWHLTEEQQAGLLNTSPLRLREWQAAPEPDLSADTLARISHLLNIYDGLHVIPPSGGTASIF